MDYLTTFLHLCRSLSSRIEDNELKKKMWNKECRVYLKVFTICTLVYMGRRKCAPPPKKKSTNFPSISIKTRTSRIPNGRNYLDIRGNFSMKCDFPHAFWSLWYLVIISWYLEWQLSWTANDIHDSCSLCKLKAGFNLIVIVRDSWAWPSLLIYACSF